MPNKRIFEIDFLKATAIIMMVIFHIVYDLNEFIGIEVNYSTGFWHWFGRIAAFLFILLAGINSGFSNNPTKRGIIVLGFGVCVTMVTFIFLRNEYVRFGILHFLGVSMIASSYLKRINNWVLLIIATAIILSVNFGSILTGTNPLIFFENIFGGTSIDYYPLFPYISLFIFGILAYKIFYYKRNSILNLNLKNKAIYLISKYSLFIYLIHQPIIIGVIFLFKFILNN